MRSQDYITFTKKNKIRTMIIMRKLIIMMITIITIKMIIVLEIIITSYRRYATVELPTSFESEKLQLDFPKCRVA